VVLPVPDSVAGQLGVAAGDDYESRLKTASYRAPSGTSITFDYEDVRRSTELRGSAYAFPGVDEHFVQRTGHGSRVYPMRCVFWGPQHDLVATAFEAACLERGQGTLTHPLYGTFKVTPFGTLARRNDMVEDANASIVEVTFWTSLPSAYPGALANRRNEILAALDGFDVAAAQQFAGGTSVAGVIEKQSLRTTIEDFLGTVSDALSDVAAATDSARAAFDDQLSLVERGLETLVGQPLLLAQNMIELTKAPARALASIQARMDAYRDLAQDIFGSRQGGEIVSATLIDASLTGLSSTTRDRAVNNVRASELVAMSAVAGSVRSVLETEFTTKPQAQAAALLVLTQLDELVGWREGALEGVGASDDGEAYQQLYRAVSLVAGFLVEVSFSLVPERVIVLSRARTIIDLAAELFGQVDERLDELIEHNGLTGSEILELPAGKAISYYEAA